MRRIKKYAERFMNMSPPAYFILSFSFRLSCVLAASSLLVTVWAGEFSLHTLNAFYLARELYNAPVSILLTAVIGSACVEDIIHREN